MTGGFEKVEPGTAGEAAGTGQQIRTMSGEPDFVHTTGRSMADYGHLMSEVGAQLTAIKDSEISQWKITGAASDKLRSSIGDAAALIEVASALYLPVGQALSHYGSVTQHYQQELNGLAVTCKELWTTYKELVDEHSGSTLPAEDDPGYADALGKQQQLETDIQDAWSEWSTASARWNNTFVGWRKEYEQAVTSLSDPDLEAIRKGEDPPGDPSLDLYPTGVPTADDINQAGAGDCYLLAVLAGMAQGDPQRIKDMITANPDGTYTVHFADGDITVGGDQIPDNGQADWVRIIEGAYEIHEGGYADFNDGGRPEEVMRDIYGEDADRKDTSSGFWDFLNGGNDIDDSYGDIEQALDDGRPVVADALNGQLGFGDPEQGGGHALSVIDVYEVDGVRTVLLRNPWGANNGHEQAIRDAGGTLSDPDDGYIVMSMEDFAESFTYVEIANR